MTWRPIATAPKDGAIVDLWADGSRVTNAHWHRGSWATSIWTLGVRPRPGQKPFLKISIYPQLKPTHWMPRPDAPLADVPTSYGDGA